MGRGRDEGPGPDEMVEQRLGQGRALGRVRPGPKLVEQDERARPCRLDDPGDRTKMPGKRREGLGDGLLVPDVGEHVAPDRQPAAGFGRDMESGLVHQAEQPEGAQGDRLATGVRSGHDQRAEPIPQPDIGRDDLPGQARVPGGQQDHLGVRRRFGPTATHLGRQRCLGTPQVEAGQRIERFQQRVRVGRHEGGQLIEDPGDLLGLGDLRLAPGVPELDRDERLDEQGLAAA